MDYSYIILGSDIVFDLQLRKSLEEYEDFMCTDISENSSSGLNFVLKYKPDVIFIDLRQNALDYFKMITELQQYINSMPLIIGISNSKKYAYKAIKHNFFDYWLIPYDEFDIRKSILKLHKQIPKSGETQTICLQSYKDFRYIDTKDILYLKADNNATDFFLTDGSKISTYKTLKTFELSLPENFIRVHQSYILNSSYISRINYGKSICSLKQTKLQLPFSKSYIHNIDVLKKKMTKLSILTNK